MRALSVFCLLIFSPSVWAGDRHELYSPDGNNKLTFFQTNSGLTYEVERRGKAVLKRSRLGFSIQGQRVLGPRLKVRQVRYSEMDVWWEQVWGEEQWIQNRYRELLVELQEGGRKGRRLNIRFRAFEDGIAFRYEFPEQESLKRFNIQAENTEFNLAGDFAAWWIPAFTGDRYERLYQRTSPARMPAAHTPVTFSQGKLTLAIHEANLTDFASMTLEGGDGGKLKVRLVPWSDGVAVRANTPVVSPWRTLQIGDQPGDLITSYMILNLNEPNRLADTSWIRPRKYMGIWWGMHIGHYTWGSGSKHGANTGRAKAYIDAAKEFKIPGLLIEGWNIGWDGNWIENGDKFRFTESYPDFNLREVADYARKNGVALIGHHETAGGISNYESQVEDAFALYRQHGVDTVKTGYVQTKVEGDEWHHGQYMVRHYRKIVELAAKYNIMLDVHEPIKDTGIRRTYPNMMTREGARGIEYNAWSKDGGNPPEHATIIPFTRGLAGPFDMTPGIFDLSKGVFPKGTTLAKQLALYVVVYSPLHMAADMPHNYKFHPALKFIQDVPTDWKTTRVLAAEIGDYLAIARQDRHSQDWYVGAVNDENPRELEIPLEFLKSGVAYAAEVYRDGDEASYHHKPHEYRIEHLKLTGRSLLKLKLAAGGGFAMRLSPK